MNSIGFYSSVMNTGASNGNHSGARWGVIPVWTGTDNIVIPVQTHGCRIAVIDREGNVPSLDDTDGIISLNSGMPIGVKTADCVPIVIYAPDIGAVGAFHAGWKGTLNGIVSHAIERLANIGADPALMIAAFGPCVCVRCYEVGPDLADIFRDAGYADCVTADNHIDLEGVNYARLKKGGVRDENIIRSRWCTKEDKTYPSWRRSPGITDRLLTWIELI